MRGRGGGTRQIHSKVYQGGHAALAVKKRAKKGVKEGARNLR